MITRPDHVVLSPAFLAMIVGPRAVILPEWYLAEFDHRPVQVTLTLPVPLVAVNRSALWKDHVSTGVPAQPNGLLPFH